MVVLLMRKRYLREAGGNHYGVPAFHRISFVSHLIIPDMACTNARLAGQNTDSSTVKPNQQSCNYNSPYLLLISIWFTYCLPHHAFSCTTLSLPQNTILTHHALALKCYMYRLSVCTVYIEVQCTADIASFQNWL